MARAAVKRGVGLRPVRFADYIHRASRSQGRQERGAGMAEIIFELRLIFPQSYAAADYQRG